MYESNFHFSYFSMYKKENKETFRSLLSRFNIIPFPFRISCFKDIQERKILYRKEDEKPSIFIKLCS